MGNYSFLNELQSSSEKMQKQIHELSESAEYAEILFYSNPASSINSIRNAGECCALLYAGKLGVTISEKGFSKILQNNIFRMKLDAKIYKSLCYISENATMKSVTSMEIRTNLMEYLYHVTRNLYGLLGGKGKASLKYPGIQKKGLNQQTEKYSEQIDVKQCIGAALKQAIESTKVSKPENHSAIDQKAVEELHNNIKQVLDCLSSDQFLKKEDMEDVLEKIKKESSSQYKAGVIETNRLYNDIISKLDEVNKNRQMDMNDIYAKLDGINQSIAHLSEVEANHHDQMVHTINGYHGKMTDFVKQNEDNLRMLSDGAKKALEEIKTITKEIKPIVNNIYTAVKDIKPVPVRTESVDKSEEPAPKVKAVPKEERKKSTMIQKVTAFLQRWKAGSKIPYYSLIYTLMFSLLSYFIALTVGAYRYEMTVLPNFVVKLFFILWLLVAQFIKYISFAGFVVTAVRCLFLACYEWITNKKVNKASLSRIVRTMILTGTMCIFSWYIHEEFYSRAASIMSWRSILVHMDTQEIQYVLQRIIQDWGNL